jgi:MSHA biogenesis protein MshL
MKNFIVCIAVLAMMAGCAHQSPRVPDSVDPRIIEQFSAKREVGQPEPPAAVNEALLPPLRAEMPRIPGAPVEQRFDLVVNNASAQQVFMSIVSGTRYSMVLHPQVTGAVSVNLKDVTVREALDALREVYGYEYRLDGTRVYILPAGLQTRMFQVNYLVGTRSGSSNMSVSSGTGATSTQNTAQAQAGAQSLSGQPAGAVGAQAVASSVTMRTQSDFWAELASTLRSLIGTAEGRNVVINSQSGVILVRAMPAELRVVDTYLNAMRLAVERQVILEAKIVEVTLSEGAQSGVNWSVLANSGNLSGLGASSAGATLSSAFTPSNALSAAAGAAGSTTLGLALQTADFALLLRFLESQGSVQVLSSPRVATVNNQKAVLKVGLDQNYVSQVQATPVVNPTTGAQTGVTFSPTLSPYFSGVSLDITPQIDSDGNILLHIHPLVSRVDNGVLSFNFGGGLGQQNLSIAKTTINETDTVVRVQDGNIVALGGLMQVSLEADRSGIPGAQDAPGIGAMFGNRSRMAVKKELVILVKPTVIQSDRSWQNNLLETRERLQSYGNPSQRN